MKRLVSSDRIPLAFQIEIIPIREFSGVEDDEGFDSCGICGEIHPEMMHANDPFCEICGMNEWHGCECEDPPPRPVVVLVDPTKKY